jgi:hypothetical protein
MTDSSTAEVRDKGPLLLLSQRFAAWLAAADVCLALTTYQAGRLFFIGRKDDGGVRAHERIIEQCQGLWTDGQTLWTSARYMLWRFENVLADGATRRRARSASSCRARAASPAAPTSTTSAWARSTACVRLFSSTRCSPVSRP